jgi:peptidylprolyl isomerase/peptidyl-prolyl cis-trans isomerase D
VQITDEDLKNYYNSHKDDFKRDESVKLKYILFSDAPVAEDSTITEKQLRALTKELKRYTANDTDLKNFVNSNSTNKYNDTVYYKPNELAPEVANFLFSAKVDSISDVIKASDGYHLVRLFGSKDGDAEFTNASHILINFGTDTNGAKAKAEEVFKRAKSGEDFTKLAADFSDDATNKFKGGNLGWFTKGAMVKEFEDASMNGKVGDVVGPIKTQYGYHIIKINDRQKKVFKAADIKRLVKTSAKTKDAIRKRAEDFTFVARKENFEEEAKKLNLQVQDIPSITKTSFIPSAGQNQNVTKFAFNESKKSVSDPIKIQGGYAIYYITDKYDAGYMNLDEIKDNVIKPRVLIEKKLDLIKPRITDLRGKISNNDLASIRTIDQSVVVQSADSFSVSKPDPQIGTDFDLINALFKLTNGQISDPIRTNNGYYIIQMRSITPFDQEKYKAQADIIRQQLTMQKKQSIVQDWLADLKEHAVIVDNRDKYFH